ncbi:uncharacterized protein L3040_000788 [Drepanopeziza brunnea f. sp. 'multigermtubi']|uniref:cutinase n=1 Tax=Marssonina brunnea f. sp. multigermtubi (strain MB_m1) TaxID=1072389 RepID=K1XKS2_MARBU|nr:cutinase [Drepanopeziza brunnea f. sp. 'multigermtubi' MB_m1]EKD21173.1 cutinase [Drepanopeziza brunnea f. sp. 'multigermtubi' MB_m1]KAJ5054517.1 hypothetical protein L3040_000788 [Drepanopeziza brunnea f. sp. 'multigermtubi']
MRTSASLFLFALPLGLAAPVIDSRAAGDTMNGLAAGAPCKAMTVVFARGTTETGNVGTLSGPPYFKALMKMTGGDMAVQGVEYPADIPGFLAGGDAKGSQKMAQLVMQAMTTCPDTKVVMAGYSQGGQLVHNAAAMLPPDMAAMVSSAVIFGDPMNGKPVQGVSAAQTKVICHNGDLICAGTSTILQPHLTYSQNAQEAATFTMKSAGM